MTHHAWSIAQWIDPDFSPEVKDIFVWYPYSCHFVLQQTSPIICFAHPNIVSWSFRFVMQQYFNHFEALFMTWTHEYTIHCGPQRTSQPTVLWVEKWGSVSGPNIAILVHSQKPSHPATLDDTYLQISLMVLHFPLLGLCQSPCLTGLLTFSSKTCGHITASNCPKPHLTFTSIAHLLQNLL